MTTAKASQVIDWTRQTYEFMPRDGGLCGSLQSWGRRPKVGALLALRNGEKASVYRVVEFGPAHIAADYDGYIARVEFVPGRDIEDDLAS